MKFQLSTALLATMVASTTAFSVVPASNVRPAATQLEMSQQQDDNINAPMSLLAASLLTFTSASAILPAPVEAAVPSKEQISKMSGPEKEYYTLVSKMDLETQSIASFTKNAKDSKAEATKLTKLVTASKKAIAEAEATLALKEDNYAAAKGAAKGEFTKAEMKDLKDRVATAKAAVQAAQASDLELTNKIKADEKAIEIDEDAIVKAKDMQKSMKQKVEVSQKKMNKYLAEQKKQKQAKDKKAADLRKKKEKEISKEEQKLKEMKDMQKKAEKAMMEATKKVEQEQKKIDGMKGAL